MVLCYKYDTLMSKNEVLSDGAFFTGLGQDFFTEFGNFVEISSNFGHFAVDT